MEISASIYMSSYKTCLLAKIKYIATEGDVEEIYYSM